MAKVNPEIGELVREIIERAKSAAKPAGEKQKFVSATDRASEFIENFNMKPSELMRYLEIKVIKQKKAIRVLSTKICSHYNAIRGRIMKGEDPMTDVDRIKSNILLIGKTGVGKTFLLKLIAKKLGVPFVKVDATKYTEAGYVGGDVEDIIRDLAENTKDSEGNVDIGLAQYGIVFIDEADKIASSGQSFGPDVSRKGVQQALLTLMEEADVTLKTKMDIAEQMKMIKMIEEGKTPQKAKINTKNILFILSGAFPDLEEIIKQRSIKKTIGFGNELAVMPNYSQTMAMVETRDLIRCGFEPEFIGRIPVRVVMDELDEMDFFEILDKPASPIITQFEDVMASYGTKVFFDKAVLKLIAKKAALENTGARGLLSAFNDTVGVYESYLPDINIPEFYFTLSLVDGSYEPVKILEYLKKEYTDKMRAIQYELEIKESKQYLDKYISYVFEKCGLTLEFDEEVTRRINEESKGFGVSQYDYCVNSFRDWEMVFEQLIQTGRTRLLITDEAIVDQFKFMEDAFKQKLAP